MRSAPMLRRSALVFISILATRQCSAIRISKAPHIRARPDLLSSSDCVDDTEGDEDEVPCELDAADETAATAVAVTSDAPPPPPAREVVAVDVLRKAARRAIGGGLSGWLAGVVQVLCLMWLRTAMNYQYRYGTSTLQALRTLYAAGGIRRFYQGLGWALIQTPLSRFGDVAANSGVLELLRPTGLPVGVKTACANCASALWRVGLTPIDTFKTTLQVEGVVAYELLRGKVKTAGIGVLYSGCLATWLASFVSGYPWFFTFNALDERLPPAPAGRLLLKLSRSALLGVSATCVSDVLANSLRVVKTTRQTSAKNLGYWEAVRQVIDSDGLTGLLGRGLLTRLITNAIQTSVFAIVWKLAEERINARQRAEDHARLEENLSAASEKTSSEAEDK